MKRLWINSMEDAAIKAGFDNLKGGADYDNLYAAASCRERADWLVGYSCTRLVSILYGVTLSVGRVQSPSLAMIVNANIVAALLKDGRVAVKGLFSEKTGKKYDASVILNDIGDGFVNFKLEF